MDYDFLIVGAGFSGSVCAQQLAQSGSRVLLIDRRNHVGGNAHDTYDDNGILIHPYGPHIFHTNSQRIFDYLSRFTRWRFYEHRVMAEVEGELYPIPINRTTINRLYDLDLDEPGVERFFKKVRVPTENRRTSEDVVLSRVGHDLCDKFFRGYTAKQWGLDISELAASVAARIPTRTNDDDRYFNDRYQYMPADGYHHLFRNLLDHKNIEISLNTEYADIRSNIRYQSLIFSGPIDEFFDQCFGQLPYRSLEFKHRHLSNIDQYQPVGTVNYPNDFEYTRITEFKHLTGQRCDGTSIVYEFPRAEGDPFYPIPRSENQLLFGKYLKLTKSIRNVFFVGRLAQYRYYNMDQAVGAALALAERLTGESGSRKSL